MKKNPKNQLIAQVALEYVKKILEDYQDSDSSGKLRFDSFEPEMLAACMNRLSADSISSMPDGEGIEIKLPVDLLDSKLIEHKEILFSGNAAAARNSYSSKRLTIFANGNMSSIHGGVEDVEDTLRQVSSITQAGLLEHGAYWVKAIFSVFPQLHSVSTSFAEQLAAMFNAFNKVLMRNITVSEHFLYAVAESIVEGNPINNAVDCNLSLLGYPHYIEAMPRKNFDDQRVWERAFEKIKEIPSVLFDEDTRPLSLTKAILNQNYQTIKDEVTDVAAEIYKSLVSEDGCHSWKELLCLDWEGDKLKQFLSEKPTKEQRQSLAEATLAFFEESNKQVLDIELKELGCTIEEFLKSTSQQGKLIKSNDAIERARIFYSYAADSLSTNVALDKKWDKYLFNDDIEDTDFLNAILRAAFVLAERNQGVRFKDPVLLLVCENQTGNLLNVINVNLREYFSTMYRGLESECNEFVVFRFARLRLSRTGGKNLLFDFDEAKNHLTASQRDKYQPSHSLAKVALELKFQAKFVERDCVDEVRNAQDKSVRIRWCLKKNDIRLGFAKDFHALGQGSPRGCPNAFRVIYGRNFKQTNSKGLISQISLSDSDSFGLTGGSFVYRNGSNLTDLRKRFESLLASNLSGVASELIRTSWDSFVNKYEKAIKAIKEEGLGAKQIPDMYATWGRLLHEVNDVSSKSQQFRQQALSILLSIGVFSFVDSTSANAVVVPWHPVRLYELHCDFIEKMGLVKMLVLGKGPELVVSRDFQIAIIQTMDRFKPQFVVTPPNVERTDDGVCRDLLAPVEHLGGYTLYSRIVGENCRNSGFSQSSVEELGGVVQDYQRLMPQASNSLNIALPDAITRAMPLAVMADLATRLDDTFITVHVGGFNAGGYKQRIEEDLFQGITQGSQMAGLMDEAGLTATSLKSKLQFAVVRAKQPYVQIDRSVGGTVRPFDLAFIDRFLTYSAKQSWESLPKITSSASRYDINVKLQKLSRRLVSLENEYVSKTLLCDREMNSVDQEYINATSWLLVGRSADGGETFALPCLNIDCSDLEIHKCVHDLHKMAQWVVTTNDLIDRRQLINNNVKLVRYKRNDSTGKAVIVSSEMPTEILTNRIAARFFEMNLGLDQNNRTSLARQILDASYRISGYVALRSAKLDAGANEIIGLVLSDWLAHSEAIQLCHKDGEKVIATASFLVDDYASFFISGSRLADLLCLILAEKDSQLFLHIYVTESKFYQASALSFGKHESENQLAATIGVLEQALVDSERAQVERSIWLGRLANFVLSMAHSDVNGDIDISSDKLIRFADRIASGDVRVSINGASHVFIHDEPITTQISEILSCNSQVSQYVIGSDIVSKLLHCYSQKNKVNPCEIIEQALQTRPFVPTFKSFSLVSPWPLAKNISLDWVVQVVQENHPGVASEDSLQFVNADPNAEISHQPVQPNVSDTPQVQPISVINQEQKIRPLETMNLPYAPTFSALVEAKGATFSYSEARQLWAKEATEMLRLQLVSKGIPARVNSYSLTPNGCLVSFEGDEKLTTKEVLSMKETLLSTKSINIVFARPAPGRFNVLFNDPRQPRESVSIWNAWSRRPVEARQGGINFSYIVGLKEEDGQMLCLNPLNHDPHTLIAGGTGSGKTVLVQTMLLDMAATNPSTKLKLFILDPKGGIDFGPICQLPHMAAPIVSDKIEAMRVLNHLADEMDRRYELLRSVGAKNIQRYNAKVSADAQLPAIFLVHDELPDWMQDDDYAKCLTSVVTRLATKARASGIYLILVAQRPDKDVIPMQIRENLGNRLVMKLPAQSSEIALGEKGAENLLGKGHLAAKLGGTICYAQAPFVDEENGELDEVVDAIASADREWS